jgi:hypothetical protein
MTDFQPLGCDLGRAHVPHHVDADPPTIENNTMGKTEETTDKVVRLLAEAGGTLAGADLRDQLGVDEITRRMAISALRKAGRISSEGATVNIVYRLEDGTHAPVAGHRIANPKKAAKPGKKLSKAKVAKLSRDMQLVIDKPSTKTAEPVTLQVAIEATVVEDLQPIPRQYLRRVLALALSRPGDILDVDRQALAAVAGGC